jgi:hypothetical protein
MMPFDVHEFVSVVRYAAGMSGYLERYSKQNEEMEESVKETVFSIMEACVKMSVRYGMATIGLQAERISAELKTPCTVSQVNQHFQELLNRIEDQLTQGMFVMIAANKIDFYSRPDLFGSEVTATFPSATVDLAEAGKCFAAERYTASVFHLMRVMEVGLHRLGKRFKIAGMSANTWGTVIGDIDRALEPRRRNPRLRRHAQKYDALIAHFRSAKNGWRDRVCHSNVTYAEEEARAIFSATEGFMRGLASQF